MTLDERHRRILFAVVTEYIASGKAVSSRRIAKRYAIKLSPATIRNVLVDLEDAELLHQPHTSAGRVPTDAGFRCFVDAMATAGEISDAHRTALIRRLQDLEPGADAVRETGQLLSRLTGTATIIARPAVARPRSISFGSCALEGTDAGGAGDPLGRVENRVVVTELDVDDHALERVNNYLAELVGGRTLRAVRDVLARPARHRRRAVPVLRAAGTADGRGDRRRPDRAAAGRHRRAGRPLRSARVRRRREDPQVSRAPSRRNRSFSSCSNRPCWPTGSRCSSARRRPSTMSATSASSRARTGGTARASARSESSGRPAWTTRNTCRSSGFAADVLSDDARRTASGAARILPEGLLRGQRDGRKDMSETRRGTKADDDQAERHGRRRGGDLPERRRPPKHRPEDDRAREGSSERDRMRDQLLRIAADFDNFRKRSRKEIEEVRRRTVEDTLREVLPIVDNLERAAEAMTDATDVSAVAEGVHMVLRGFEDIANRLGSRTRAGVGTCSTRPATTPCSRGNRGARAWHDRGGSRAGLLPRRAATAASDGRRREAADRHR